MKTVFLTLLVANMTTLCFSQKAFILAHQEKKGFVALSAGASLPIGQFASCSPTDQEAGWADRGRTVNISAGYQFVGRVGLMVRGEQHRNGLQTQAMLDALYLSETDIWTARADSWVVTTLMAGPYLSIPIGRFSVDARLLAGQAMAVLPGTELAGNFGDVNMAMKTTGSQSKATAFGGGVSLRYRLGRVLALQLNGDFTRSELTFDNLTSTAWSSAGRSESSRYSSCRLINVASVSGGVVLLFGNNNRPF